VAEQNAALGSGRELFGWGFFNRRNGEFSSGVDRAAADRFLFGNEALKGFVD
jgi:hypothetical protein